MSNWLTIDEIVALNLPNFPSERSAMSRKATRDGWERRKRETGGRGVTYEYRLPTIETGVTPTGPGGGVQQRSPLEAFTEQLDALKDEEINLLTQVVKRKGVEILLYLLSDNNITLLQQPETLKAHMLQEYVTGDHVVGKSDAPGSIDKVCAPADETQATTESLASEKKAV